LSFCLAEPLNITMKQ